MKNTLTSEGVSPSREDFANGNLTRILLSPSASEALTATDEKAFVIVSRAMRGSEEPETAGRWEITLAPVEWETARDAAAVLMGEMKATTIKKTR